MNEMNHCHKQFFFMVDSDLSHRESLGAGDIQAGMRSRTADKLGPGHLRNSLASLSMAVDDGGICHPGIYTVITRAGNLIGCHAAPRLEGLAVYQS